MKYKKRWIIVGILLSLLANIFLIHALGSGAALGGGIDIPLGNQTFPNITNPVNNITNNTTNPATSNDASKNNNDVKANRTDASINSNNYHSKSSNANKNSNKIKVINELKESSDSKDVKENKNKENIQISFFTDSLIIKQPEFKIVLIVNTLCLFFAFVVLRDYTKSLEEEL